MAFPLWVARVTRHPLGDRPHVQAYFPRCACGERKVKAFFTKKLTTLASVERSLVAKVKMGPVLSVRAADRTPPKPHPRRVSVFFVLCWSRFACAANLEHETKANCNKAKAAAVKLSGTLLPSTVTGHGPGMPIDVDGPADAATTALAATLDAALAATATQQSGNSGADSKRKRRELGPAVELPGVPPAASPGAAPTAPPNAPPRKKTLPGSTSSRRCRPPWAT